MNRKMCILTAAAVLLISSNVYAASSGADLFKAKCAMCHGQDGAGSTPMGQKLKIRDLRSADVQKQSDQDLTAIVTNGKPPMPAYGKTMTPADIKQLVVYLRNMQPKA